MLYDLPTGHNPCLPISDNFALYITVCNIFSSAADVLQVSRITLL